MALDQQYTSISTTVLSILKCRMAQRWNKLRNWHNYCLYGCKDISSPPTHYPRSIPSSHHIGSLRGDLGFSLDLWLLEETRPSSMRIEILNRKADSRTLERQTNRKMERKKRYDERPRRPPTPSFTPPSACRWNDGNKEEVKQGDEQRTEEEKWKDRSWLLQNKPPPCLWLASCHCDIFLPSLSHSTDTQMNQPWHRLMALCHLCIVSPFISAPYNISYKDTHKASAQQSCSPRTFDQMTVKCFNTNPMRTTSSNPQSCSSARDHCLSIHTETPTHLHTILQSLISLPVQVVSCVVCVCACACAYRGGWWSATTPLEVTTSSFPHPPILQPP